jgi:hypothetical protein
VQNSNRRTRLIVTLTGLAIAIIGAIVWLVGDENQVSGANRMDMYSSSSWGDVLGFDSDQDAQFAAAVEQKDTGDSQVIVGTCLMIVGVGVFLSRWFIPKTKK